MRKILCHLVLGAVVTLSLPTLAAEKKDTSPQAAADQRIEERHKERKSQALSERVGKKLQKAFDAYTAEDISGAIALLQDIKADKEYDKAVVARFLGNMYALQEGSGSKAIKALKEAVDLDVLSAKDHAQSMLLLADLLKQEKRYQDAIKYYDGWTAFTGEESVPVYLSKAQALYEMKKYAEMIPPLDRAIAISPKPDKNAYILKLSSYYERKDYKSSVRVLEDLVKYFPGDERWWVQLGTFYMMVDNFSKALATMEVAYLNGMLKKDTEFKMLVQLYANNGIPYKSAVLQEKFIKDGVFPRDVKALTTLANTWHTAKEFKKARAIYLEAAAMSGDGELYRKAGEVALQSEAYNEALESFQKALDAKVAQPERVYLSMADAYISKKQYRDAYQYVKKAEQYPKTEKTARSWASYLLDKAKQSGQSI